MFLVAGCESRQELVVNLIGEVMREGTELRAKGNAWLKADDVITDKTSAKDVIVLKLPSLATLPLEILYENQICTLETVCHAELPVPTVVTFPVFPTFLSLMLVSRPRRRQSGFALWTIKTISSSSRSLQNTRYDFSFQPASRSCADGWQSPDSHFHLVKPKMKRSLATAASGTMDTRKSSQDRAPDCPA
jgi:hypothetical protein